MLSLQGMGEGGLVDMKGAVECRHPFGRILPYASGTNVVSPNSDS